jgi:hypothetical protein
LAFIAELQQNAAANVKNNNLNRMIFEIYFICATYWHIGYIPLHQLNDRNH